MEERDEFAEQIDPKDEFDDPLEPLPEFGEHDELAQKEEWEEDARETGG